MVRTFDRNMLIMMIAIMVGVIVVTYFVGDIVYQSQLTQLNSQHITEIENIEGRNINFTSGFLASSVLLDSAREDRAFGNYHFDLAHLFYMTALSKNNITLFEEYQQICIENCTSAMPMYTMAKENFLMASSFFNSTKKYTDYQDYIVLLSMYVNLSESGARLTVLRYNASLYLQMLAENLTFVNGSAVLENATMLEDLFNTTMMIYGSELNNYEQMQKEIAEYDIKGFSTIREPV
jgi:hypothetical protein